MWGRRKRRPLEKINNVPVEVLVGRRDQDQVMLELREPTMYELLGFIEGAVEKIGKTYSEKWADRLIQKAAKGKLDAGSIRLLQPAYVPICEFIAHCGDREDLKSELHKMLTPAQYTRCVNAMLFLVDVEELAVNFTEALAKVSAARKAMKQAS